MRRSICKGNFEPLERPKNRRELRRIGMTENTRRRLFWFSSMPKNPRSRLQESLLHLYLRLNGFFVTGFIVHSPVRGNLRTEIDALAIRMGYHAEPERLIVPSSYFLGPAEGKIDLLICEVKGQGGN